MFNLFRKRTHKQFWMVIRKPMKGEKNNHGTQHRHYTERSALKEAQRLADVTGESFLVLTTTTRINPTQGINT